MAVRGTVRRRRVLGGPARLHRRRRVLPVVGPELLTVEWEGRADPALPRRRRPAAERSTGFTGRAAEAASANHELNDAVSAARGREGADQGPLPARPRHPATAPRRADRAVLTPLRELAAIRHFDLFATTTPDDLLARALDAVRFDGTADRRDRIRAETPDRAAPRYPRSASSEYTAVFYLFGKADVSPFYAIHDEDALEFPTRCRPATDRSGCSRSCAAGTCC